MDLTTLVVNVARDILAAQTLAQVVAIMIGIGYCAHALTQAMKKTAAPGADISGAKLFASFFIGALMLHFAGAMGHLWASMSGASAVHFGMVSYDGAAHAGAFKPAINAALTIVSTFGWWYGLKGFTLLRRASGGQGGGYEDTAWKGFVHILGGAAMINITTMLDAFKETAGLVF
ncbi:TraQ-like type IV secretion system protein (IcmC/DotN protein)like protein [Candidatus Glomeribacter gigasporarum BEG34]|uniref:TraQ-like type IV secretion system protein (IcmC/DotN protein)like protein n=1 Tax=Candidatus Glomeribacter gigasporarum BEG34 TaxID=1070319 RepID=G2J858_9BURK|nr:conjugal transfer protein TraQ [Candidatus Glomeribacter gigasporarum]CCD28955.1 TraQ-like type IV secretion system protein (IcmC/DotN protein)like protein [Candidatus Glomeribacter gigasporarum BEG34]